MTTGQIITRDSQVLVRFGRHEIPVPGSLGRILTELTRTGRAHTGIGSPATSRWLFPGGMPGRPITASRLGGVGTPLSTGLANGADLVTVRDRLGHSDLKTTSKYLHVMPGAKDVALDAMARALAA